MKRKFSRSGHACLLALACLSNAANGAETPGDRLVAMKKAGAGASITVFPTLVADKPMPQVGDVIGIMLEKAGMDNIDTSALASTVSPGADLVLMTKQFGEFVRGQNIKSDYALYTEFIGTHKSGFTEVRTLIVNRAGAEVWSDRQTRSDAEFKRIAPREPMQCCMIVVERVRSALALPDPPSGRAGPGKVEKRFAEKAGMPSDKERFDMEPRLTALTGLGATAEIEVYPVQINGKADADAARQLVTLINDAKICKARPSTSSPVFELKPSMNEQTRLWDLARASRAHAKSMPSPAPYTLFAEYIMNPSTGKVGAVHFVVCDCGGEWTIVDFQNNHHEDFNAVSPHTSEECGQLLVRRLRGYMK